MTANKVMSTGSMAIIILTVVSVTVLYAFVASADTQQSEKECSDNAYKYYLSKGFAKMKCGSNAHYNEKMNACFIHLVCDSNRGKKVSEYVEDVYKRKNQARYVNTRPTTVSGTCIVDGKKCKDYFEFHDQIRLYLED